MTIEQRLERLERQNGRLKRGMMGMVIAGLALLMMGQALPTKVHDVVQAKKIEIFRNDGRPAVQIGSGRDFGWIFIHGKKQVVTMLGASDSGDGLIKILSPSGKDLVNLTSTEDGGGISTLNRQGKNLVTISTSKSGHGLIKTFTSGGKEAVGIGSDETNSGFIVTNNQEGKISFDVGSTEEGNGLLNVRDSAGNRLIGILPDENGEGRIVQFNRANKPKALWPPPR